MSGLLLAELTAPLAWSVQVDAAESVQLPGWYVWVPIVVIDVVLLAGLFALLALRGSRVDAEQIQGAIVLVAVVAAFEVAAYLAIAFALPPLVRVLVSVGVFLVVIFVASTNWTRRSLRTSAVAAVLLISFMLLSVGSESMNSNPQASPTVFDAIGAGAETVLESIPGQPQPPLLLAVVGWAILGLLLLGFWRLVERRSSQQLPGPITIDLKVAKSVRSGAATVDRDAKDPTAVLAKAIVDAAGAKTVGTDSEAQLAVFRAALLLNLKEPGAVPGASALQSVTDLIELPGISATWVTPIVTAVKNVLNAPTGYKVVGEVVPPDTDPGPWVVLLRILDAASGEQVDVCSLSCDTDVQACRAAGYRAAAVILSRSNRIASWANWDSGSADALALYNNADKCDLTDLARAVALAPSSGVLLQLLASRYDLEQRHIDSLMLCARAVTAHPRYPVARYRMTVSLGMLARSRPQLWDKTSSAERKRVIGQLQRACEAMRVEKKAVEALATLIAPRSDPDSAPPDAAPIFQKLTQELFVVLRQDTTVSGLVARSFRRSERDAWWLAGVAKFGKDNPRRWSRMLVLSASLTYRDLNRRTAKDLKKMERLGRRTDLGWQISYNLACYYSRRRETDKSLTWLEMAMERPRSGQLTGAWLAVDPDLENIRHTARFRWVADQLAKSAKEGGLICRSNRVGNQPGPV